MWRRFSSLWFTTCYLVARVEDGALHIYRVQYSDAGEYYCTAENRAGKHQRRTILTVTGMSTSAHHFTVIYSSMAEWQIHHVTKHIYCLIITVFSLWVFVWVCVWCVQSLLYMGYFYMYFEIRQDASLTPYAQIYSSCWLSFMPSSVLSWTSTSW